MTEDSTGFPSKGLQIECNHNVTIPNGGLTVASAIVINSGGLSMNGLLNVNGPFQMNFAGQAQPATSPGFNGEPIGKFDFNAFNNASQPVQKIYGSLQANVTNATAGAESGNFRLLAMNNGTYANAAQFGPGGVVIPDDATLGDVPRGAVNMLGPLYISNVPVIDAGANGSFANLSSSGTVTLGALPVASGGNRPLCISPLGQVLIGAGGSC